jgi:ATP-binding protein involved in chromosome partitioning
MSGFTTPSGEHFAIFGEGGGGLLAEELEVPLLAQVPLTMALREQSDGGLPVVLSDPSDSASRALVRAALRILSADGAELPMTAEPEPAKAAGIPLPMA